MRGHQLKRVLFLCRGGHKYWHSLAPAMNCSVRYGTVNFPEQLGEQPGWKREHVFPHYQTTDTIDPEMLVLGPCAMMERACGMGMGTHPPLQAFGLRVKLRGGGASWGTHTKWGMEAKARIFSLVVLRVLQLADDKGPLARINGQPSASKDSRKHTEQPLEGWVVTNSMYLLDADRTPNISRQRPAGSLLLCERCRIEIAALAGLQEMKLSPENMSSAKHCTKD
ncbi:unnamed protein product [Ectocarpus fasciculatus]